MGKYVNCKICGALIFMRVISGSNEDFICDSCHKMDDMPSIEEKEIKKTKKNKKSQEE